MACFYMINLQIYGASVADKLDDGRGILQRRYYRQHCTQEFKLVFNFVLYNSYLIFKWLHKRFEHRTSRSFVNIHIRQFTFSISKFYAYVFNSISFLLDWKQKFICLENAIPIKSWFCDPHDTCLLDILPFLDALRLTSDVRSILGRNIHRPPPAPPFFNFNPFSNLPSPHSDDPMADYPDYDMNMSMNGRDNEYETTDDDDVDPPQLMSTSSSSYHTNLSFFTQNNNYIHVG